MRIGHRWSKRSHVSLCCGFSPRSSLSSKHTGSRWIKRKMSSSASRCCPRTPSESTPFLNGSCVSWCRTLLFLSWACYCSGFLRDWSKRAELMTRHNHAPKVDIMPLLANNTTNSYQTISSHQPGSSNLNLCSGSFRFKDRAQVDQVRAGCCFLVLVRLAALVGLSDRYSIHERKLVASHALEQFYASSCVCSRRDWPLTLLAPHRELSKVHKVEKCLCISQLFEIKKLTIIFLIFVFFNQYLVIQKNNCF